jgi:multicomponent Na+:H+ antiporter subunit D
MSLLLTLLLPAATSLLSFILNGRKLLALNLASSFLLLVITIQLVFEVVLSGSITLTFGNWPEPFGIAFYADGLSAILVLLIAMLSGVVMVFMANWESIRYKPAYFVLLQCLVASAIAVSLAADLFNLYVWFELMLVAVLGLIVLGGGRQQTEAALKYFSVSMIGTLIMLSSIGMIHGATGHLNFNALAEISASEQLGSKLSIYNGMLLLALLLKIGAFPLFAWLPAAYHALPAPLLALVGGLLTKISVYVLMRLSGYVLDLELYYEAIGWLAVITMLSGVLGAAYHWDLRRILSFHIVSQIGFLLLGVALASPAGQTGTAFFLFHNILVKANLFLIAGLIWMSAGHYDLRRIGGLYPARPLLAVIFLLSALSLIGVPPTSGFWGKMLIIMETFSQERYLWAGAALVTGLLTLYSMSKIWIEAFWKLDLQPAVNVAIPISVYAALVMMSLVILVMGLMPGPLIGFLEQLQQGVNL